MAFLSSGDSIPCFMLIKASIKAPKWSATFISEPSIPMQFLKSLSIFSIISNELLLIFLLANSSVKIIFNSFFRFLGTSGRIFSSISIFSYSLSILSSPFTPSLTGVIISLVSASGKS